MNCYECQREGAVRPSVALCHHCSAALCLEHSLVLTDPVHAQYPICKTIELPLRARIFLCSTCWEALRQTAGVQDIVPAAVSVPKHEPVSA